MSRDPSAGIFDLASQKPYESIIRGTSSMLYVCINSVRHDHMWPHGPDRFCVAQSQSGIVMPVTFQLCQLVARLQGIV